MNKRALSKVAIMQYDTRAIRWGLEKKIKGSMLIRVQAEMIDHRVILILNLYNRQDLINPHQDTAAPVYRIFLGQSQWEFATQDLTESKQNWTGMTLTRIRYDKCGYGSPGFELDSKTDLKLLNMYFGFRHDPNWESYIKRFQEEVWYRRRLTKNSRWITETDQKMAGVPRQLPEDFGKWIQTDALYHSRYIYYQYDKKKKGIGQSGYCTHCHRYVSVDGAKHRTKGTCPVCGSRITYLCETKAGYIRDRLGAYLLQESSSGLVLRYFEVDKKYYPDYRKPELKIREGSRVFLGRNMEWYTFGTCEETNDMRWYKTSYMTGMAGTLYTANLKELLEGTPWQYSGLFEYASSRRGEGIRPAEYLRQYVKHPELEHIVKMGLTRLTDDHIKAGGSLQFQKGNIFQILGISKEDTRYLQKINGGQQMLKQLKQVRKAEKKISYEQFGEAAELFDDCFDGFVKALEYGTAGKILGYLKKQVYGRTKDKYKNILKDWGDYISMGQRLGYDFKNSFVLFPDNLKERHDAASFLIQEEEKKKQEKKKREDDRKIGSRSRKLEDDYGFETKTLKIVVPRSSSDIVREGQELHHCVGTYIQRVAAGETMILFIREKDNLEKPFFTMEVKGERVIQCRGRFNCGMTDEVRRFVERFKKKCLEEKDLKGERKGRKTA